MIVILLTMANNKVKSIFSGGDKNGN